MNNRLAVGVILCHLAKAVDCVNRGIIVDKPELVELVGSSNFDTILSQR